jgi:hypothetical protein
MKTTTYYGKIYGLVYSSTSEKQSKIYADILNKMFGDYNKGKIRKTLQNMKHLVLVDHVTDNGKTTHYIYVRQPYDKLIHKV